MPPIIRLAGSCIGGQSDFDGRVSEPESVQEKVVKRKKINNLKKTANKRPVLERENQVWPAGNVT